MTLERGHVLRDRYRIVQLLDEGGQGSVYRAWDLQLQSPCAIKEYPQFRQPDNEQIRQQAVSLLGLNHPNLPRVFDFFTIPGQASYLVMEVIEGEDLNSLLVQARNSGLAALAEGQILPWMLQVCDALIYLHNQNPPQLHLDVKPANIIITSQGQAMLVDLGIISNLDRQNQPSASGRTVTPGFSPPEQYGSAPLDARSDVYALGASLYYLLSGVLPPDSVDLLTGSATLRPIEQLNPAISPTLRTLITQALQPKRENRLASVSQFRNALASAYAQKIVPPAEAGKTVATSTSASAGAPAGVGSGTPPVPPLEPSSSRFSPQMIGIIILLLVVLCLIGALVWYVLSNRPGGSDQAAEATRVFQTVQVEMTQNALATLFASATVGAQGTPELTPTETLLPGTPTPTSPGVSPTPLACGKATFIADISVPDNTVMMPNTAFTKTWRVRNDSTCTWDSSYALVFAGGTLLSNRNEVPFPGRVGPGETVDLSIEMTAPATTGSYRSEWLMRTNTNTTFGVGKETNSPLYTVILVTQEVMANPLFAYDFTARYCDAQWRSASGTISCNNLSSDGRGSALPLVNAPLERAIENEAGLWVRPDQNQNGFIVGEYPPYLIQPGDRFMTELSCLRTFTGCNVSFQLDMLTQGGSLINLGVWNEVYDEKTRLVDLDLGAYVGQTVRFQLRLVNNDRPAQANGVWFLPSIRNVPVPIVTPTVTAGTPYP